MSEVVAWPALASDPRQPANVAYNAKTESLMTFSDELARHIKMEELKASPPPQSNHGLAMDGFGLGG